MIRRAHALGEPWDVVAVAMTVPVLRRMLARLARPVHLERAEVEQEALAAVAAALRTVDVGAERLDRELFSAADRAGHRLVYAARRRATRETDHAVVRLHHLCSLPQAAVAAERRARGLADDTLVAAVCPGMVDTATSRPWFSDYSQAQPPARAAEAVLDLVFAEHVDPAFYGELVRFGKVLPRHDGTPSVEQDRMITP